MIDELTFCLFLSNCVSLAQFSLFPFQFTFLFGSKFSKILALALVFTLSKAH